MFFVAALTPQILEQMHKDGKYGMYIIENPNAKMNQITGDNAPAAPESMLLVTPKLGAMILHSDKNGKYYIKGKDPKYLSTDVVVANNGEAPLFSPDLTSIEMKAATTNAFGYDSLHTATMNFVHKTTADLNGNKSTFKNASTYDPKTLKAIDNWKDAYELSPKEGLEIQQSILEHLTTRKLAGEDIPLGDFATTDQLRLRDLTTMIDGERKARVEFFANQKVNEAYNSGAKQVVVNTFMNFARSNKSSTNDISPIIKTLINDHGGVSLKQTTNNLLGVATERAIIRAYAKLESFKDNGTEYTGVRSNDIPDIGTGIANEFTSLLGLKNTLETQKFTNDLARVLENDLGKEKFTKGTDTVKLTTGETIHAFRERSGSQVDGETGSRAVGMEDTFALHKMFGEDIRTEDILGVAKQARDSYLDNTLSPLNRYISPDKSKAMVGLHKTEMVDNVNDLSGAEQVSAVNAFTLRLDGSSMPIHYSILPDGKVQLGHDAQTYMRMANTVYKYKDGAESAKRFILELDAKNDVELAQILDKDLPDNPLNKTTLLDLFDGNSEKAATVKADVEALRKEMSGHLKLTQARGVDSKGLTFPVMKVSTTRMQYAGDINPQQGYMSKLLFTSNSKTAFDPTNHNHITMKADAVRWAMDEGDFGKLLTKDELKFYGMNENGSVKGQRWEINDDKLIELGDLVRSKKDFALAENATFKDRLAFKNLDQIDDISTYTVEYDAITSMQGIVDNIYSIDNPMTGSGSPIAKTGIDVYMKIGKGIIDHDIVSFFKEFDEATARKWSKDPGLEGGYGMDPGSIVENIFEKYITKAWMENKTDIIDSAYSDLKNKILFDQPDYLAYSKILREKIDRLDITKDNKDALFTKLDEMSAWTGTNASQLHRNSRTLSFFDNLESTVMKIEASVRDKSAILEELAPMKESAKVLSFMKKIENQSHNDITALEIKAASQMLAKHTKGSMDNILKHAFGGEFMAFKDIVTKQFTQGYIATMHVLEGTKITSQLRDSIYSDLRLEHSDLKAFKNEFHGNTTADFIDFLYSKGLDPLTSKTVHDLLPGYHNPFGDKVLYVAAKNSGFNADSGLQYLGLTMINNPLPYVLHSFDASLVGIASSVKGPMNMRWDAFYGTRALSQAKMANKGLAYLRVTNPIDTIKHAYDTNSDIISAYSNKVDKTAILEDAARRSIVGNGDVLTAAGKADKIKAIESILYDKNEKTFYSDIIHEKSLVDEKIQNIKKSDTVHVNNYANGRPESAYEGPAGSLTAKKFRSDTGDVNFGASEFDLSHLTDINTKNITVDPTYSFNMLRKGRADFIMDINRLTFKDKSSDDAVGRQVAVSVKPNEAGFWKRLSHELVHAVAIKLDTAEGVSARFNELGAALEKAGIKVGEKSGDGVKIYEENQLRNMTGLSKIEVDQMYGNELAASMLDNLIHNELLAANKGVIAKMQDVTALDKQADPLILIDRTGKAKELYTLDDLTTYLSEMQMARHNDTINTYASAVHGIINGSTHVRDLIFEKPKARFETTLKDSFEGLYGINKAIDTIGQKIQDTPALELFDVSGNREVIESVLAQSKGLEKITYEVLNSVMDKLRVSFDQEFGTQAAITGRKYGTAWLMGMNKLFYSDMEGNMSFMNVKLKGDLVHNGEVTGFSEIQHRFQTVKDQFYKTISGGSKAPATKNAILRLQQDIQALSEGVAGKAGVKRAVDVNSMARKLEQFAKRNMDDTSSIDFKLATQKLASMEIIGKNSAHYEKFKDIYSSVSFKSDMFETYMNHANIHESKSSLFGENVDMQFVEHGKTVQAVKKGADINYKDGDVVGTAKLPDGTEFDVITMEAGERIIAAQQSNLITMELTNMEKGMFKQKVGDFEVVLNGQRIITEGKSVDKNIITQLARNVYARKKDDISKDLGYRGYQLLRDKGLLLTKEEKVAIEQASPDGTSNYQMLDKNNPISKSLGTDFYYDKRWQHYFEGTKGIDVKNFSQRLTGDKQFAGMVENGILGVYNATNVLKRFILVARPQSYINSYISSMLIYAHHADGLHYKKDLAAAKSSVKKYKSLVNKYADAVASQDTVKADAAWATLKKDPTHKMMEAGLSDTIKADVYKAGTNREMAGYGAIYRATGSHQYANSIKTLTMDPSMKLAKAAGDVFENTEMIPKLMLYHNRLAKLGHQKATTTTIMAYPSYNNLNPALNLLNIVNPYMKFFASTPRMMGYAANQSPRNMMLGIALANGIVPASYAMQDDEEMAKYDFYKENGMAKIPFLPLVYPTQSLFPQYANPLDSTYGNSLFGVDFLPSVVKNIFNDDAYLPGKYVSDKK